MRKISSFVTMDGISIVEEEVKDTDDDGMQQRSSSLDNNNNNSPIKEEGLVITEEPNNNQEELINNNNEEVIIEEPNNNERLIIDLERDRVPEVEAQPISFFDRSIPLAFGYNQNNQQEEEVVIDKGYCLCIPYNKESKCSDKLCECCLCMCCPVTLALKTCFYSISAICVTISGIEQTFCPEYGKTVFGINKPIIASCFLYSMDKCCKNLCCCIYD